MIIDINNKKLRDLLTSEIIGSCIEIHKILGPGLLESAYEECLCYELKLRNINYERQKELPLNYKGKKLDCGYHLDLLVEDLIIIEIKSVEKINQIYQAQLLTYLKLMNKKLGYLINFNVPILKAGIKRMVHGLKEY